MTQVMAMNPGTNEVGLAEVETVEQVVDLVRLMAWRGVAMGRPASEAGAFVQNGGLIYHFAVEVTPNGSDPEYVK